MKTPDWINNPEIWHSIPEHMHESINQYIENHFVSSDFLYHIVIHDIYVAAQYADDININRLKEYINLMYNEFPMNAHGSEEIVAAWTKHKVMT